MKRGRIMINEEKLNALIKKTINEVIGLNDNFENALEYIRQNKTWSSAEERAALKKMEFYRCGIDRADYNISNAIYDLMNEYMEENNLTEDFWDGNVDNIFLKL